MKAIHIILGSALITTGVIKAAPALAETPAVAVNVVRTADLDLSSERGQRQLDQRLVTAAREVCGTASDSDLEGKNAVRACRGEVLARAHAERDQLIASAASGATIEVAAAR